MRSVILNSNPAGGSFFSSCKWSEACLDAVLCMWSLSAVLMFIYEQPTISGIVSGWSSILYAGALSTGVAYTIQVIAQKGMNPAVASLIMSMESVISVIAGWLILNQKLSRRELIGCGLMFAAIILVQLPERNKQNS